MCGICGWIEPGGQDAMAITARMTDALHHRGPDDCGLEAGRGWGLGFRRLSILDLSPAGHQPMSSPDGACWLAFNGEIYNYRELRHDLERDGEVFRGTSDTEVLLRLLMRHGGAALPLLNGMFALAYIDTRQRRFLLARDRLGVKPLYYRAADGALRFASELKALMAWPGTAREIVPDAIAQYLTLGYVPGGTCALRSYAKLPPAHALAGSLDDPVAARAVPYWDLAINDDPGGSPLSPAAIDELEALFDDAVRIRLRSDVPVGVFLSGGIDSGLVAAAAARANGSAPLALTVGFSEAEADESGLARASAAQAGLNHRVVVQEMGGLDRLDRMASFFDEPFGDPSALPTFTLCEAAAAHATVFLSGDGGDEAFGGYRRVIETWRRRGVIGAGSRLGPALRLAGRLMPDLSGMRHRLHKLALADDGCAAAFDEVPGDAALLHVAHPRLTSALALGGAPIWDRWARTRGRPLTARQRDLDYHLYLPDDVLVKVDRASMAHSIEVRSPLLDVRLVEWAARLPRGALLDGRQGKLPLRTLAARRLPASVCAGTKRGFGLPLDAWFRSAAGREFTLDRLLARNALDRGFWTARGVEGVMQRCATGTGRSFGTLLWRLLMLEAWARLYAGPSSVSASRTAREAAARRQPPSRTSPEPV